MGERDRQLGFNAAVRAIEAWEAGFTGGDAKYYLLAVAKDLRANRDSILAAAPPLPPAEPSARAEAFDDLRTHRDAWRSALENSAALASEQGEDADSSYWQHEIKAFDRTFSALSLTPSAVGETYAAFQQRRGRLPDLIEEAIETYAEFMKDDDYNAQDCLDKIIDKLKTARDWYDSTALDGELPERCRIPIWNACKTRGMSDDAAYGLIGGVETHYRLQSVRCQSDAEQAPTPPRAEGGGE